MGFKEEKREKEIWDSHPLTSIHFIRSEEKPKGVPVTQN